MKLAIFDFNGTIFPKETLPFLFSQWYKNNYSKIKLAQVFFPLLPLYLKYKLNLDSQLSKEQMEREAMKGFSKIFVGMNKNQIENFFQLAQTSAKNYYNKKIVKKIYSAKQNGYYTVLLSGAFKMFLIKVGEELNFDKVIGSELYLSDEKFDDSGSLEIMSGSNKLKKLKQEFKNKKIRWDRSYAYADSYHDLKLLKAVGHPVAVDPDSQLTSTAKERNWQIIRISS